ncbi:MAG TPA: hypothetical protein VMH77_03800 [Steroidobacteraceae bacterium]|nr:hypothetical protein [Steroidobacteraceae bacterium]
MNSMISRSGFLAAALCTVLLAGCDSIKDVKNQNFTANPQTTGVLAGTIIGLGSARPITITYDGNPDCVGRDSHLHTVSVYCTFYGAQGQTTSSFSFGSGPPIPGRYLVNTDPNYPGDQTTNPSGTITTTTLLPPLYTGTAYNLAIPPGGQPYGKICTIANGSGTIGGNTPAPVITCVNDPAVQRYSVTVNTGPLANLAAYPGAQISLITEDGTTTTNVTGSQVVFANTLPNAIFNSGTSLPAFQYQLRATYPTTSGGITTTNYCTFTPSNTPPNTLTLGGVNFEQTSVNTGNQTAPVVPTGNVTAAVNACGFTVNFTVAYNGSPSVSTIPGGIHLQLLNHFTRAVEQDLEIASGTSFGATVQKFATPVPSNSTSVHELVVTRQPTGEYCIVTSTVSAWSDMIVSSLSGGSLVTGATGDAVMFVDPAVQEWWTPGVKTAAQSYATVTCRTIPASNILTGTYQRDAPLPNASEISAGTTPEPRAREFLTFFNDGSFIYGINFTAIVTCPPEVNQAVPVNFPTTCKSSTTGTSYSAGQHGPLTNPTVPPGGPAQIGGGTGNYNAASGVAHGFYVYDPTAGTIVFTVLENSDLFPSNFGLSGAPGYAAGAVTARSVTKTGTPSHLSMTFTGNLPATYPGAAAGTTSNTAVWNMTEPNQITGQLTGNWISTDHLRVFSYQGDSTYAFHMGDDGIPTIQDFCFIPTDDSTQSSGYLSRHPGSTGACYPGAYPSFGFNNRDIPEPITTTTQPKTMPRSPYNYDGRLPGAAAQLDNRAGSPAAFSVTPGSGGAPDTLTIQATLNGVLISQPITFTRDGAN